MTKKSFWWAIGLLLIVAVIIIMETIHFTIQMNASENTEVSARDGIGCIESRESAWHGGSKFAELALRSWLAENDEYEVVEMDIDVERGVVFVDTVILFRYETKED